VKIGRGRTARRKRKEKEGGAGEREREKKVALFSLSSLFSLLFARPALFRRHRARPQSQFSKKQLQANSFLSSGPCYTFFSSASSLFFCSVLRHFHLFFFKLNAWVLLRGKDR
jgi:hypothetical protein